MAAREESRNSCQGKLNKSRTSLVHVGSLISSKTWLSSSNDFRFTWVSMYDLCSANTASGLCTCADDRSSFAPLAPTKLNKVWVFPICGSRFEVVLRRKISDCLAS